MPYHLTAILAATGASYNTGSLWYLALGRHWQSAAGLYDPAAPYRPRPIELVIALVGQVVLAAALTILFSRLHIDTMRAGLAAAAAIWLGFVLPTLATNLVFQRRNPALLWMDGGHWLLVLVIQGAVAGALG